MNAGEGISVTVNSKTSTKIEATFTIGVDAAGGNRAVTVRANNRQSNSKNFFVQIPSRLVLQTTKDLQAPVYGDVVDFAGTLVARGFCGVYRNYGFILVDQEGQRITQPFVIDEDFASYSGTFGRPTARSANIAAGSIVPDLQLLGFTERCLRFDEHESFLIGYTVKIGSKSFDLSTINYVERGDYAGVKKVELTNGTP